MYIWLSNVCIYGYLMYVYMVIQCMYIWLSNVCIYGYLMYVYMVIQCMYIWLSNLCIDGYAYISCNFFNHIFILNIISTCTVMRYNFKLY